MVAQEKLKVYLVIACIVLVMLVLPELIGKGIIPSNMLSKLQITRVPEVATSFISLVPGMLALSEVVLSFTSKSV